MIFWWGVDGQYRKLAGILIELQGDTDGQSAAIIGVGINLNLSKKQTAKIDQPSIDMQTLLGEAVDPNLFLAMIIKELSGVLSLFENDQFIPFKEEWLSYHAFQDKPISITLGSSEVIQGRPQDVSDEGSLIVMTDKGLKTFSSGEVTVRGT